MTKPRKLSAKRASEETLEYIRSHANPAKAASYQRFFKEPVNYYGLGTENVREVVNDLVKRTEESWTIADAVRFCKAMVKDTHMEARGVGYQVVGRFVSEAPPELLADVKHWLERSCGNWGLVDNLAPTVLAPLLERHPNLIPEVVSWTDSPNQWVRRGATVAFVPLVGKTKRQKRYLTTAYLIASRLFGDDEDLMHKAVGWLLREAGKADMARLERYLLKNGPKIPRTAVRYAIERFPKAKRKQLLEATREKK